jgi:hypothetical protein
MFKLVCTHMRRHLIAYVALFFALGGSSFAAVQAALPKNSVGTRQLKRSAVTAAKIKNGAVTAAKIKNGAVTGAKIQLSTLGKVPAAATADTATTATNATNATNATTAATANSLPNLTWAPLTLENGWTVFASGVYGTPSYTKDHEGFVHLSGALDGQGRTSTRFATLPAGFRPNAQYVWVRAASTNGASDPQLVDLYIPNTGEMYAEAGTGANMKFVSLEGVTFYAG